MMYIVLFPDKDKQTPKPMYTIYVYFFYITTCIFGLSIAK